MNAKWLSEKYDQHSSEIEHLNAELAAKDAEIVRLRKACVSVLDVIELLGPGKPIVIGLRVIKELRESVKL